MNQLATKDASADVIPANTKTLIQGYKPVSRKTRSLSIAMISEILALGKGVHDEQQHRRVTGRRSGLI